ncbi:hypothetical protein Tco_0294087 [Tanacetum coccineum]
MIGHSLNGYLDDLQFGVGVSGRGEAILHVVNRLIEDCRDDVGISRLLVYFKNAFNLVHREVMSQEVRFRCLAISRWMEFCYSKPARFYYGEHILWSCQRVQQGDPLGPLVLHPLIFLELIMEDGPRCGLHLNVDKIEVFWPKEDPRSRLVGVFPPNIARPLHGVKLLGGPAGFGDWQWRLATLPFAIGGLSVYFKSNVLNYAFLASRLQSIGLQTKPLRHAGIGGSEAFFEDALCVFNMNMETDLLSNPINPVTINLNPHKAYSADYNLSRRQHRESIAGINDANNVTFDVIKYAPT